MKVEVIENYQVADAGTVYRPGDVAEVPDDVARRWLAAGWVTKQTPCRRSKLVEYDTEDYQGDHEDYAKR
jgi:NADPH-dependent 2,4-dienoyl-CoA reductase/sulfur reductase-like enzyme